jgi:hypothetical protein
MRHGLSVFFVFFYGLGSLMAIVDTGAESRLPACCRRHGAHHCAMSDAMKTRMVQASSASAPVLTIPAHCPLYPADSCAITAPVYALAPSPTGPPIELAQFHVYSLCSAAAQTSRIKTRTDRGPPTHLFL